MKRRSGLTLIEVLTAIFIAGIGLLALLTLFPLGAMNMAQSVQDDRIGHVKENALAISIVQDYSNDPFVTAAMNSPGGGLSPTSTTNYTGPSYPVLVDPMGDRYNTNVNYKQWVGGVPGGMRRCGVSFLTVNGKDPVMNSTTNPGGYLAYRDQQLLKWCTLLDDMEFERDGTTSTSLPGTPVNNGVIERTPNFSWAWIMRQTRANDPGTTETQCVIYRGRTLVPNTGENIYQGYIDAAANSITLYYDPNTQDKPNVKPGSWLLDFGATPTPRGFFYRAISVTELSAGTLTVEVQNRLRVSPYTTTAPIAVMDNVVEVTNQYP